MGAFKIIDKIITMVLILLPLLCFPQKQGNQWCFGDSAGIDWTDPENPQTFKSASRYRGSCASIADSSGNLLFYCANIEGDGLICPSFQLNHIYNRNHEVMESGDCLPGGGWYTEHTIIPMPGNDSLYYVFSVDSRYSISYNVVDMNANEGLGKVIERDHQIESFGSDTTNGVASFYALTIDAVKHGNGKDWWVIARSGGAGVIYYDLPFQFYLFLVTEQGITVSYIPINDTTTQGSDFFQLFFNEQGNKLYSANLVGLLPDFDFDRCNGDLVFNRNIDSIFIGEPQTPYFFGEVSPSGRFLYASTFTFPECSETYRGGHLLQFDLWQEHPLEHADTLLTYGPLVDGFDNLRVTGALRLAPDGKIYFSTGYNSCNEEWLPYTEAQYYPSNTNLSVINYPDSLGAACGFEEYSFYLGGNRTYLGLPNNPNYNLEPINCDTVISNTREQKSFLKSNFNIFPNPCYYNCILEYKPAKENGSITIATATGKIIFTEQNIPVTLLQHGYEVNTSAFAKGVYTVTLVTGSEVVTKRLVKL
jgi:hypothetical protein